MATQHGGGGRNSIGGTFALSATLAILSYVPFEAVAKGSLIFCAILFIMDPIPPISRLLSLVTVIVVAILTRLYNHWKEVNDPLEPDIVTTTTTTTAQGEGQDTQNINSGEEDATKDDEEEDERSAEKELDESKKTN